MLEKAATPFRPKLMIAGASVYPQDVDYPYFRLVPSSLVLFVQQQSMCLAGYEKKTGTWSRRSDVGTW
ncbi:hypothetical protein SUGI_1012080 [Cryptomeria japonica]|nr:hypothetical protein SUGI_1012080 [Cryptomeria japonica]